MSAVDNYREFTDVPPSHYLPHVTLRRYADAAIMELEWAITQWRAEVAAMTDQRDAWADVHRLDVAEVARLNLICDRLAAAGHS
jgi:hypothetical protein